MIADDGVKNIDFLKILTLLSYGFSGNEKRVKDANWLEVNQLAFASVAELSGLTLSCRDRAGGGAGRAAAPPLFCTPAPTFCAKKKNN